MLSEPGFSADQVGMPWAVSCVVMISAKTDVKAIRYKGSLVDDSTDSEAPNFGHLES